MVEIYQSSTITARSTFPRSTSGQRRHVVPATDPFGNVFFERHPQWGDTKLIVGVENIFDTAYRDASTFANVAFPQSLTNPLVEVGRNFTAKVQHTF